MKAYETTIYIDNFEYYFGSNEFALRKDGYTPLKPKWDDIKFEVLIAIKALMNSDEDMDANSYGLCKIIETPNFELRLQAGIECHYFEYKNPFFNK